MKLVCSQSELNAALQLVSRAVASRPTHPVLANVLLTADAGTGRLSLTGFDLNLGIQTSLAASVEASGAVTLPARLLGEIVSRLSADSPITLATDEAGEQVDLTSLSGSYQMRAMPADEFPDLPLVENGAALRVDATALVQALRGTLFASSGDEAKQLLTGVHLRFQGRNLEAASTDGHRLAVLAVTDALKDDPTTAAAGESMAQDDGVLAVTLPARSLREVERLIAGWKGDDPVTLFMTGARWWCSPLIRWSPAGPWRARTPITDSSFPMASHARLSWSVGPSWRPLSGWRSWRISTTMW